MNFKTTIVLIVLLALAGVALLFNRDSGTNTGKTEKQKEKLFDIAASDVNKLSVVSSDGKKMALEKSGANWRLTDPVNAAAESFEVDSLVRAITELESRGGVDSKTASAQSTGLATPRYTIDLATSGGKSYTLLVGDKTAVGDNLYVQRKDKGETTVVSADLVEKLDKPATDYRDKKLIEAGAGDVQQITLVRPDGKITLVRSGTDWKITEPTAMPAEKSDADDIAFALTGLRATEFVSENTTDAPIYKLDQPRITATLSTTRPAVHAFVTTNATSAPTSQPAPIVIEFGAYDDVLKKNVMVTTSTTPVIAKVAATVIDTLSKKPIELRDKKIVELDPEQVSSITIQSDLAATTKPTSRPASKSDVVLQRRKESPAATKPATKPATTPATTQSTQPATQAATQPATKWEVVSGDARKPGDDSKIDSLLSQLHPLRVQKYLESAPTTQPTANYVVQVTTQGPGGTPVNQYEIKLVDPGNSKPLIGTYNSLSFEADRFLVDRLSGDFLKSSAKPTASPSNEPAALDATGP